MNVIITGASKGLGRAIAEKFAEDGQTLFICARQESDLRKAKQDLLKKQPGCKVEAMAVDLSKKKNVIKFADFCLQQGAPHILVNNAGMFLQSSIHTEADDVLEKMLANNLYSAYHLTRILLPKMIKAKSGHIFNMCSIASVQPYANGGAYNISKFALLGFSKNLRQEMKPYNIKVTSVLIGQTNTSSWNVSSAEKKYFIDVNDVAKMIYAASQLSPEACVEEILLMPQLNMNS